MSLSARLGRRNPMVTLTTRIMNPKSDAPSDGLPEKRPAAADLASLADQTLGDLVQLFKLVADETRLRILYYLIQTDELNVRTFCRLLQQSQPAVSHHLALLRIAGIIECRRDGKHNFYHLVPKRCQ